MKKINFKSKRHIWISLGILLVLALAAFLFWKLNPESVKDINIGISEPTVKIAESESQKIKLIDYQNENFSMKVPEGWKVETGGVDMFYAIRVYDPEKTENQIYVSLKAEPFLKTDEAKKFWQNYTKLANNYYNSSMFANAVVLNPPTTENLYNNFNSYTQYAKKFEPTYSNFNFPFVSAFKKIEQFESNSYMKSVSVDDKTIRASFENEKGKKCEGLFMATMIKNPGTYAPGGVDPLFNTAYNVIFISAAENEFVNYQKILNQSLSSLVYKDSFINTTIKNGQATTQAALKANSTVQAAFDSYNSAWSKRQTTYDVTGQKQSDATLGYERVYDTETGDVYKAYNGFTGDYTGSRYKAVTNDSMYTQSVSGYIEK